MSVGESVKNMSESIRSSAASALGEAKAGLEDNMEMILKCAVAVGAGYVFWKLLTPDVFKWESKITVKRGKATKTYSAHAAVDTDEETHSEVGETGGCPCLHKNKTNGGESEEDSIEYASETEKSEK